MEDGDARLWIAAEEALIEDAALARFAWPQANGENVGVTVAALSREIAVSGREELLAALERATGGEVILLAAGTYGAVELTRDFGSDLVLVAEPPGKAVFAGLAIRGGHDIRLDGITIDGHVRAEGGARKIEYLRSTFRDGIYFRDAADIRIVESEITGGTHGAIFNDVAGFELTRSIVRDARSDLVRVTGASHDFRITDNALVDVAPRDGDHPDAIQIFAFGGHTPYRFEISGNFIHDDPRTGREGLYMQGIFIGDPAPDGGYRDVLIAENLIAVGSPNAIFLNGAGANAVIRNNTVLSWEYGGGGAGIRTLDSKGVSGAGQPLVRNNVARLKIDESRGKARFEMNLFYRDREVPFLFADSRDRSSWRAFLPKPGSRIDVGSGIGALGRLSELSASVAEER